MIAFTDSIFDNMVWSYEAPLLIRVEKTSNISVDNPTLLYVEVRYSAIAGSMPIPAYMLNYSYIGLLTDLSINLSEFAKKGLAEINDVGKMVQVKIRVSDSDGFIQTSQYVIDNAKGELVSQSSFNGAKSAYNGEWGASFSDVAKIRNYYYEVVGVKTSIRSYNAARVYPTDATNAHVSDGVAINLEFTGGAGSDTYTTTDFKLSKLIPIYPSAYTDLTADYDGTDGLYGEKKYRFIHEKLCGGSTYYKVTYTDNVGLENALIFKTLDLITANKPTDVLLQNGGIERLNNKYSTSGVLRSDYMMYGEHEMYEELFSATNIKLTTYRRGGAVEDEILIQKPSIKTFIRTTDNLVTYNFNFVFKNKTQW